MAKRITTKKAAALKALGVTPNTAPAKRGTVVKAKPRPRVETWVDKLRAEKEWTNPRTPKASERGNVKVLLMRPNKCTPAEVAKLANLEYVRIFSHEDELVAPFVDVLRGLEKLVWLSVTGVRETLVAGLGKLARLRRFDVHGHAMFEDGAQELPEELFGMPRLEELELHGCRISSLPASIGSLAKLQRLLLWQNPRLERLPTGLARLAKLQTIDIVSPHSLDEPHAFGVLAKLPALTRLRYSSRGGAIPDVIGTFPALTSISAAHITSVPTAIAKCTTLESLDLGWCEHLETLPPQIAKLPALRWLNLYGNDSLDFAQAVRVIATCERLESVTLPAGGLPAAMYETLRAGGFAQASNMYGDRWIRGDAVA